MRRFQCKEIKYNVQNVEVLLLFFVQLPKVALVVTIANDGSIM
jgi:hypothetical protein